MIKRYLTAVTEEQQAWINRSAKELKWTAPQIVQLAIDRLIEKEWESVKKDLEHKQLTSELAEIRNQKEQLTTREKALHAQLTEGGFIRL